MLYGIGIDIIETKRVGVALSKKGFMEKVFTEREALYCNRYKMKERHFAGRFAAKEAALKALGLGLWDGVDLAEIEVLSGSTGKPKLLFFGKAGKALNRAKVKKVFLSISHCKDYAVAQVVLEA